MLAEVIQRNRPCREPPRLELHYRKLMHHQFHIAFHVCYKGKMPKREARLAPWKLSAQRLASWIYNPCSSKAMLLIRLQPDPLGIVALQRVIQFGIS